MCSAASPARRPSAARWIPAHARTRAAAARQRSPVSGIEYRELTLERNAGKCGNSLDAAELPADVILLSERCNAEFIGTPTELSGSRRGAEEGISPDPCKALPQAKSAFPVVHAATASDQLRRESDSSQLTPSLSMSQAVKRPVFAPERCAPQS